jgi:hypothetical protein
MIDTSTLKGTSEFVADTNNILKRIRTQNTLALKDKECLVLHQMIG